MPCQAMAVVESLLHASCFTWIRPSETSVLKARRRSFAGRPVPSNGYGQGGKVEQRRILQAYVYEPSCLQSGHSQSRTLTTDQQRSFEDVKSSWRRR